MKKILTFVLICSAALIAIIIGCGKEKPQPVNPSAFNLKDAMYVSFSNDANGWGIISCKRYGFGETVPPQYSFRGEFFNSTATHHDSNRIDVGPLSNGVFTIPLSRLTDKVYEYDSSMYHSSLNAPLFGSSITLTADGDSVYGIPDFYLDLYNPSAIKVTGSFNGNILNTHSKSNPVNLSWNADPSNPDGKIYIIINYLSGQSLRDDPSLPTEISSINIDTDDDGSYTIPATTFSSLPAGSSWDMYVGRVNKSSKTVSGKKYYFLGYTWVNQDFKLIN